MRRLALVPLILSLALPAAAQTADPAQPSQPAPAPRQSPLPTPAITPAQCRAACDKTYYFCLAGSEQSDCAPAWSQCRIRCGH